MSTAGSGRDDRPSPLPLWPTDPGRALPAPPPPPAPARYDGDDGWPDPPAPVWPAYQPPARRRRTLPWVVGGATAVVVLAATLLGAVALLGSPRPSTARPPVAAATPSAAPSPSASAATFAAGDCLEVTSTTAGALDNAKLVRQDCAGAFFATVLSRVAGKADCPADAVSRIADAGQVLCLGQGTRGTIARAGDCVRVPTTFALPLIRTDCATSDRPFRLEAIVDDATTCPTGTRGAPYSGYDRLLCVRFPS